MRGRRLRLRLGAASRLLKDLPTAPHSFELHTPTHGLVVAPDSLSGLTGQAPAPKPERLRWHCRDLIPARGSPALTGVHRGANPGSFPGSLLEEPPAVRSGHRRQQSEPYSGPAPRSRMPGPGRNARAGSVLALLMLRKGEGRSDLGGTPDDWPCSCSSMDDRLAALVLRCSWGTCTATATRHRWEAGRDARG